MQESGTPPPPPTPAPGGDCGFSNWKGDNYCDDDNNNAGCAWDGGDCCGDDVNTQYCSACECLDPNEQGNTSGVINCYEAKIQTLILLILQKVVKRRLVDHLNGLEIIIVMMKTIMKHVVGMEEIVVVKLMTHIVLHVNVLIPIMKKFVKTNGKLRNA